MGGKRKFAAPAKALGPDAFTDIRQIARKVLRFINNIFQIQCGSRNLSRLDLGMRHDWTHVRQLLSLGTQTPDHDDEDQPALAS
jgi:hypothetical protein